MSTTPTVAETPAERKTEHYTPDCTCEYGACFHRRADELHATYEPMATDLSREEQRDAMQKAALYYWRLIARHEPAIGQTPDVDYMSQEEWDAMHQRIIAGYRFVLDTLEPALRALESESRIAQTRRLLDARTPHYLRTEV